MKGVCIDADGCGNLVEQKDYFLFDHGPLGYYVSKFDNPKAHMGVYKKTRFKVWEPVKPGPEPKERGWPQEPAPYPHNLEPERIYKAKLIWRREGYQTTKLGVYFVKVKGKTHVNFWHDSELKRHGGCFPVHWFSRDDFVLLKDPEPIEAAQESEQDHFYDPIESFEQLSLF